MSLSANMPQDASAPPYCPACHSSHLRRVRVRHGLHLLLSVLTLGLWLVSWLALCIRARAQPWECPACGHRTAQPAQ